MVSATAARADCSASNVLFSRVVDFSQLGAEIKEKKAQLLS